MEKSTNRRRGLWSGFHSRLFLITKKKEDGTFFDLLGSFLVIVFCLATVLAVINYAKLCQTRMGIDNIGKSYLYAMEESGTFTADDLTRMRADLSKLGVTLLNTTGTTPTGATQASYGRPITLKFEVQFPNPIATVFSTSSTDSWFQVPGMEPIINYVFDRSSSSRW